MFNMKSERGDINDTGRHKVILGKNVSPRKKKPRIRGANWCFTWNNYVKSDVTKLTSTFEKIGSRKYCFQEEKGKNGTQHLQGVVGFKNAISFWTLKKISDEIHWEKCISLPKAIIYCSKGDTRNGEIYTYGLRENELWKEPIEPIKLTTEMILDDMREQMIASISDWDFRGLMIDTWGEIKK